EPVQQRIFSHRAGSFPVPEKRSSACSKFFRMQTVTLLLTDGGPLSPTRRRALEELRTSGATHLAGLLPPESRRACLAAIEGLRLERVPARVGAVSQSAEMAVISTDEDHQDSPLGALAAATSKWINADGL